MSALLLHLFLHSYKNYVHIFHIYNQRRGNDVIPYTKKDSLFQGSHIVIHLYLLLVQLRTGGDMVVHHEKLQLLFAAYITGYICVVL